MPPGLSVTHRRDGDRAVVALAGELDLTSARCLDDAIAAAESTGAAEVILDMRRVAFVDSTGLRHLLRARHHLEEYGVRFALAGISEQLRQLLTLSGMARFLPVTGIADSAAQ
jgi:anti-sigma B factor antagonist